MRQRSLLVVVSIVGERAHRAQYSRNVYFCWAAFKTAYQPIQIFFPYFVYLTRFFILCPSFISNKVALLKLSAANQTPFTLILLLFSRLSTRKRKNSPSETIEHDRIKINPFNKSEAATTCGERGARNVQLKFSLHQNSHC